MVTRYSLGYIQQLSRDFSAELEAEIVEKLLEIKKHNQFIARRKNPVQLRYYVLSSGKSSPEDMVYQNILSNLNKLSPKNYQAIVEEITKIVRDNVNMLDMERLSSELFTKAVRDTQYSDLYCNVIRECSSVITSLNPDKKLLDAVLTQCDRFYEQSIAMESHGIQTSDDYDAICQFFKAKAKLVGGFLFIGAMYNHGLVREELLESYYNGLIEYIKTSPPDCVDSFIDTVCQLTKNIAKKWSDHISVEKKMVVPLNDAMRVLEKKKALKSKQKFALLDIFELLETFQSQSVQNIRQSSGGKKDDSWTTVTRRK